MRLKQGLKSCFLQLPCRLEVSEELEGPPPACCPGAIGHSSKFGLGQSKIRLMGNSLVVQWLGLCAFTAMGTGSTPGQGTRSHKPGKRLMAKWETSRRTC